MRYLKTYKIFESVDIINDIKDILIQLDDLGYSTYVQWTPLTISGYNKKKELSILINKMNKMDKKSFIGSEDNLEAIISTFEHLESFLSESNFEIENLFFDNSSYNILTNSFKGSPMLRVGDNEPFSEGKSFREIFTEFYRKYTKMVAAALETDPWSLSSLGDIGDYIQLRLKEK